MRDSQSSGPRRSKFPADKTTEQREKDHTIASDGGAFAEGAGLAAVGTFRAEVARVGAGEFPK